jgi:tryptophanyl-tRNA synthetase
MLPPFGGARSLPPWHESFRASSPPAKCTSATGWARSATTSRSRTGTTRSTASWTSTRSRGRTTSARWPQRTREMAIGLLAAGVDPNRAVLFVQSHVPDHTTLAWLLTTIAPLGELERMTQYKDKSQRFESVPAGLLHLPGPDGGGHPALSRRGGARRRGPDAAPRACPRARTALERDLRAGRGPVLSRAPADPHPGARASWGSTAGEDVEVVGQHDRGHRIPDAIWQSCARDDRSGAETKTDPGTPELCNIYALHGTSRPRRRWPRSRVNCRSAAWGCIDCKKVLAGTWRRRWRRSASAMAAAAAPERRCGRSSATARAAAPAIADETMREVSNRMGFLPGGMMTVTPRCSPRSSRRRSPAAPPMCTPRPVMSCGPESMASSLGPLTKQRLTPDQTRALAATFAGLALDDPRLDTLRDFDCSWGAPASVASASTSRASGRRSWSCCGSSRSRSRRRSRCVSRTSSPASRSSIGDWWWSPGLERQRQELHHRGDGAPRQSAAGASHRDARGSDRVPPPRPHRLDHAARGRDRHRRRRVRIQAALRQDPTCWCRVTCVTRRSWIARSAPRSRDAGDRHDHGGRCGRRRSRNWSRRCRRTSARSGACDSAGVLRGWWPSGSSSPAAGEGRRSDCRMGRDDPGVGTGGRQVGGRSRQAHCPRGQGGHGETFAMLDAGPN